MLIESLCPLYCDVFLCQVRFSIQMTMGVCGCIGMGHLAKVLVYIFRRHFRFRNVTRPDPSTRTRYWSNWRTSTMQPVLYHLVGLCPVWFCILTLSPTLSWGSLSVCSVSLSAIFMWRFRRASSLASKVSRHVGCGSYLPGWIGIKSLIGLPKMHMAGERPVSLSGVFLYWSIAL